MDRIWEGFKCVIARGDVIIFKLKNLTKIPGLVRILNCIFMRTPYSSFMMLFSLYFYNTTSLSLFISQ